MMASHSGNRTPRIIITFHLIKPEERSGNDLLTQGAPSSAFLLPTGDCGFGGGGEAGDLGEAVDSSLCSLLAAEKQGPKQGFPGLKPTALTDPAGLWS